MAVPIALLEPSMCITSLPVCTAASTHTLFTG